MATVRTTANGNTAVSVQGTLRGTNVVFKTALDAVGFLAGVAGIAAQETLPSIAKSVYAGIGQEDRFEAVTTGSYKSALRAGLDTGTDVTYKLYQETIDLFREEEAQGSIDRAAKEMEEAAARAEA